MIPAHGYEAHYPRHHSPRPVVAWSDEGFPLVYDSGWRCLVRADSLPGFDGLYDAAPPATLIPGGGWWYRDVETAETGPVVAWRIDVDGGGRPLVASRYGILGPAHRGRGAAAIEVWPGTYDPPPSASAHDSTPSTNTGATSRA